MQLQYNPDIADMRSRVFESNSSNKFNLTIETRTFSFFLKRTDDVITIYYTASRSSSPDNDVEYALNKITLTSSEFKNENIAVRIFSF